MHSAGVLRFTKKHYCSSADTCEALGCAFVEAHEVLTAKHWTRKASLNFKCIIQIFIVYLLKNCFFRSNSILSDVTVDSVDINSKCRTAFQFSS